MAGSQAELAILIRAKDEATAVLQKQQAATQAWGKSVLAATGGFAAGFVAVGTLVQGLNAATQAQMQNERMTAGLTAAYGQAAGQWVQFADAMVGKLGGTKAAFMEASLTMRTLTENYGLNAQQAQTLVERAGLLAKVKGDVVGNAERLQSAIRGEAEASEFLGLTLNDTFMKTQALGGAYKNTWEKMTDAEKAQARYNEMLRQSEFATSLATASTDTLSGAQQKLDTAMGRLAETAGAALAPAIAQSTNWFAQAAESAANLIRVGEILVGRQQEQARAFDAAGLALGSFGAVQVRATGQILDGATAARVMAEAAEMEAQATRFVEEAKRRAAEASDQLTRMSQAEAGAAQVIVATHAELTQATIGVAAAANSASMQVAGLLNVLSSLGGLAGQISQGIGAITGAIQAVGRASAEQTSTLIRLRAELALVNQEMSREAVTAGGILTPQLEELSGQRVLEARDARDAASARERLNQITENEARLTRNVTREVNQMVQAFTGGGGGGGGGGANKAATEAAKAIEAATEAMADMEKELGKLGRAFEFNLMAAGQKTGEAIIAATIEADTRIKEARAQFERSLADMESRRVIEIDIRTRREGLSAAVDPVEAAIRREIESRKEDFRISTALAKAKTEEEREQIRQRVRDARSEREAMEKLDKELADRLKPIQDAKMRMEATFAEEARQREIARLQQQRDDIITKANETLAEKERLARESETRQTKELREQYEQRIKDLEERVIEKLPELTGKADQTLSSFLAGVAQRITDLANQAIRAAGAVNAAAEGEAVEELESVPLRGARAMGGPVLTRSAYWVGERGPELFVPGQSGTIVPHGAAGMPSVTVFIGERQLEDIWVEMSERAGRRGRT